MSARTEIGIGSEFVGYRIDGLIGRGGMGVVYRAYDLRLKRTVALKLMAPELALDRHFRERFSREAELAMSLEHPNVVPIHDAGDIDGRLYLAMRFVEGTDLRALLRAETLDTARSLAICSQVAKALDAAHAKGLVHRDVKPSNVLLDANEHVYLADFGITRRLDEQSGQVGEGRSMGTPAYLAPEQIEGGSIDGRADGYSLGCLLYECLTGETPFAGSRLAVAWAHLEEEPPSASGRRPELPESIDGVIRRAMAKEPDDRYATCAAMIAAAEEAFGLRRKPLLRRPGVLLLVAASLATLVALAAVLAAALPVRGHGKPAASALLAEADTLARIDPATNAVSDVIHVGQSPEAIAADGRSIWVYSPAPSTVSEIDAETRRVRHTTLLSSSANDLSVYSGPVLAADQGGAWFVGVSSSGGPPSFLTRIFSGGGKHDFRLDQEPRAVAAGFGAVWVVVRGQQGSQLLRIDPSTGRVTGRLHFPTSSPIDSIAVGYGAVWVVASSAGRLYRINPRSVRRTGEHDVGKRASRPWVLGPPWLTGSIGVASAHGGGQTTYVLPRSFGANVDGSCCPPDSGELTTLDGWLWSYDSPTGSVYRQHGESEAPQQIRVTESNPVAGGPCLTSIVVDRGAIWVTVAPPFGFSCKRWR